MVKQDRVAFFNADALQHYFLINEHDRKEYPGKQQQQL